MSDVRPADSPLQRPEPGGGASWIGTPQHFAWLELIVKAVLVLNMLDAVLTVIWIQTGLATEANPVLADLVTQHPVWFVIVKVSLVSMGSLLLWWNRERPAAVVGTFLAFLVYYYLLLYHLRAFHLNLADRVRDWLVG